MMTQAFALKEKMAALQTALLLKTPDMPIILQEIHQALQNDPDNVTLLTEEEIGSVVTGLGFLVNTTIATTVAKKVSTRSIVKGKSADQILDDLGL